MSLIQQALEKTSRAQVPKVSPVVPAPKVWDRDPMGPVLERELIQVQNEHAGRWKSFRKILWVLLLAGLAVLVIRSGVWKVRPVPATAPPPVKRAAPPPPATVMVPQMPLKVMSGNIYHLSGIMDLGGKPMAVVNDRVVGVGDALDERAIVKEISKGIVLLDVQGQTVKLSL